MAVEKKDIDDVAEALGKKFDEFKKTNDKRIDGLEEITYRLFPPSLSVFKLFE